MVASGSWRAPIGASGAGTPLVLCSQRVGSVGGGAGAAIVVCSQNVAFADVGDGVQ